VKTYPQSLTRSARGFTLLEVLIAVVVLATGLLALTALQGALIRSSADAKARSQVAAYLAGEMDRIRSGAAIEPKDSSTASADDPIVLAASAAALGSLTQSVRVEQYVNIGGTFTKQDPPINPGDRAYFNRVELTATWTDAVGSARNLSLHTDISPLSLSASKVLVDREPPDDLGLRPIVRRQSPLSEGMIPIAVSDSEDTAATNPRPELVGKRQDTYVADTRFEVLSYSPGDNLGNDGFVRFNKRIETAYVGCSCQMGTGGFPTGGNNPPINALLKAKAFRPSYWNGTTYVVPEAAAEVKRSPTPGATQSELCDVCCRDHRDPGTVTPKFNPWIAAHDHYNQEGVLVDETGSGTFIEACRVIRVGGAWRVTPDPRVEDLALLATNHYPATKGSTVMPENNNRAIQPLISPYVSKVSGAGSYVEYIYDFLSRRYYSKQSVDRLALQQSLGLNVPDYIPIGITDGDDLDGDGNTSETDVRWMHSRSLLVDELHPDAVKRIDQAISDCADPSTALGRAQCVLPYLPVSTVNVTEIANWRGARTSQTGIDSSGFPGGVIVNYGRSSLNRYASAIARIGAINPLDGLDPLLDEQTFALIPGITKADLWLKVASPAGTAFGDATKPVRGFATVLGNINFNVVLQGISGTSEAQLSTRPGVEVGLDGTNKCTPARANNSNPYACTAGSDIDVVLALGDYNRLASSNKNTKVCNDTNNRKQGVCLTYALAGANIDGAAYTPAQVGYEVLVGAGKPSERSKLTLPEVRSAPDPNSSVTLDFTESVRDAQAICDVNNNFERWSCD
jgi:prepilin-type N-terminal cleavage/methylation domain-containing protein